MASGAGIECCTAFFNSPRKSKPGPIGTWRTAGDPSVYVVLELNAEPALAYLNTLGVRTDSRLTLSAIRCPTLMLVGAEDKGTPPELAREIAAGIAGARLVVVPECGHLSTLERPQAVTKALIEWMQA